MLKSGDGAHANLLADNVHLQEGIGCLTAAYANAITILNAMGLDYKSVIGDQTRPDAEWVTEQNIPGPNLGPEETGSGVIGITDANCLLAQIAAVNAVKYPYSVISPSVSSPYNERVVAEVGDDKYEVIKAMLEGVLYAFENGLPSLRVEELTIARKLDAYIKEGNALTSRAGAPTILPQYNGQEYFDTTNKVWYKASYTGTDPTASAWKQITN